MRCANSQNDGARLRLRLTNSMCTNLVSDVCRILMHCKENTNPIACLSCAISFARCMNGCSDAYWTGYTMYVTIMTWTSHLL